MLNHPGYVTHTSLIFFEIFISSRYHRDTKILKILGSNCKWFRVHDIFKKWQIDDDSGWSNTAFFRYLLLKITSGLKHSPRYVFLTQETKKWHQNCPKAYWYPAIGKSYQNLSCSIYLRKRKVSHYSWVSFFFFLIARTLLNTIHLIWWKSKLKFFFGSLTVFNWSQTTFHN